MALRLTFADAHSVCADRMRVVQAENVVDARQGWVQLVFFRHDFVLDRHIAAVNRGERGTAGWSTNVLKLYLELLSGIRRHFELEALDRSDIVLISCDTQLSCALRKIDGCHLSQMWL